MRDDSAFPDERHAAANGFRKSLIGRKVATGRLCGARLGFVSDGEPEDPLMAPKPLAGCLWGPVWDLSAGMRSGDCEFAKDPLLLVLVGSIGTLCEWLRVYVKLQQWPCEEARVVIEVAPNGEPRSRSMVEHPNAERSVRVVESITAILFGYLKI